MSANGQGWLPPNVCCHFRLAYGSMVLNPKAVT